MKKWFIVILLLVALTLHAAVCPETVCDPPDFAYDPNRVNYDLIGSKTTEAGIEVNWPIAVCDPDGDEVNIHCLNDPNVVVTAENGVQTMTWMPSAVDIYYLDFIATDVPENGEPLSDWGTLVIKVYKNRPPVFGCGG